jgi:hypothetical protein
MRYNLPLIFDIHLTAEMAKYHRLQITQKVYTVNKASRRNDFFNLTISVEVPENY